MKIEDYKIGDEIWWFINELGGPPNCDMNPEKMHLVHDEIREITGNFVSCWHKKNLQIDHIAGKSRKEAWETLKSNIEKWGKLE